MHATAGRGLCTNQPVPRRYPSGHETGTVRALPLPPPRPPTTLPPRLTTPARAADPAGRFPRSRRQVYIDTKPGVPAAEKYKMVATWTPRSGVSGAYTMSSPDGVHFIAMSTQPSYTGSDTGQVSRDCRGVVAGEIPAARVLSGGGEGAGWVL